MDEISHRDLSYRIALTGALVVTTSARREDDGNESETANWRHVNLAGGPPTATRTCALVFISFRVTYGEAAACVASNPYFHGRSDVRRATVTVLIVSLFCSIAAGQ